LADQIIADTQGDVTKADTIFGSPRRVAMMLGAAARMCGGAPRWRQDVDSAVAMGDGIEPGLRSALLLYIYGIGVANGLMLPDAAVLSESERNLRVAEERADEFALASARFLRGLILTQLEDPWRAEGVDLIARTLAAALHNRINQAALQQLDVESGKEQARSGDLDAAIEVLRSAAEQQSSVGFRAAAATTFVETLLQRGEQADVDEAARAIEQLAAVPTEGGFVLYDVALLRLRALLAHARGDDNSYRDFAERYGVMATSFGFEGHMAIARAM